MRLSRYFAISAIVVSLISCNKKSDCTHLNLNGKWELEIVEGGWVGRQTYPRGNGNTYTFKNNTYTRTVHYNDTTYQLTGTFSVFTGKACELSQQKTLIEFDDDQFVNVLSCSGSKLIIAAPPECIADGTTNIYRRIFP